MLQCLTAYSDYTNYYHRQGLKPGDISRKLKQEGIKATGRGIAKFLAKFVESGSVARKPGSGRPSKATAAVRTWVARKPGSGRPSKATAAVRTWVARKPGSGRPSKATAAVRTWATRGNVMTQRKYETEPTVQRNGM